MKKHISTLSLAFVALFTLATPAMAKKALSEVEWKGDSDKVVAVNITETKSGRTNASGTKITSNAHSADFPGIYFIWDSKQKDNGYLKVAAWVFEAYESFTLTSKESNTYWDFLITPQTDQEKTADNCYVFFIPKVYNNKNINMVFIGEFIEQQKDYTVSIISGADLGVKVVDRNDSGDFQTLWNNAVDADLLEAMRTIAGSKELSWAWHTADTLQYGVKGDLWVEEYTFKIEGAYFQASDLYFAADNAIAVYINGTYIGHTDATTILDENTIDVINGAMSGWSEIVKIPASEVESLLVHGENTLKIVAMNAMRDENDSTINTDPSKALYDELGNPCGVLFALQVDSSNRP